MGDRGHVHIQDTGVWLYTHWHAYCLPETVAQALAQEMRWSDPEYLARIIFDTMIGNEQGTETGFGIGTERHGDVYRVVHVNCSEGSVRFEEGGAFDRPSEDIFWGSFQEFVDEYGPENDDLEKEMES